MAKKRKTNGAMQTVVVKKALAKTRAEAKKIAEKFADRIYTSRYDEPRKEWRFRQRPPDCFLERSYGQKCINYGGVRNGVCLVYAKFKKSARKRKACR